MRCLPAMRFTEMILFDLRAETCSCSTMTTTTDLFVMEMLALCSHARLPLLIDDEDDDGFDGPILFSVSKVDTIPHNLLFFSSTITLRGGIWCEFALLDNVEWDYLLQWLIHLGI